MTRMTWTRSKKRKVHSHEPRRHGGTERAFVARDRCQTVGDGTYAENTYANSIDRIPISAMRNKLCLMVNRNSFPSSAVVMPVAATATAMLKGDTIFPITPAAELTDAVSMGLR